jgi:hypothetical protein
VPWPSDVLEDYAPVVALPPHNYSHLLLLLLLLLLLSFRSFWRMCRGQVTCWRTTRQWQQSCWE